MLAVYVKKAWTLGNRQSMQIVIRSYINPQVTDGQNRLPGKLNVKTGTPFSLHFGFGILLVFSRLLSFCVFRSIIR